MHSCFLFVFAPDFEGLLPCLGFLFPSEPFRYIYRYRYRYVYIYNLFIFGWVFGATCGLFCYGREGCSAVACRLIVLVASLFAEHRLQATRALVVVVHRLVAVCVTAKIFYFL